MRQEINKAIQDEEDELIKLHSELSTLYRKKSSAPIWETFDLKREINLYIRKIRKTERKIEALKFASENLDRVEGRTIQDILSECGKKAYPSKNSAKSKAKKLKKQTGNKTWGSYKCTVCDMYHITKNIQGK